MIFYKKGKMMIYEHYRLFQTKFHRSKRFGFIEVDLPL